MNKPQPSSSASPVTPSTQPDRRSWRQILFNRKMLICVLLGFMSGMPLYVVFQLVPLWMREHGVNLTTIGLFSLVQLPYTWKFLWSPLMDRFQIPGLGRHRGWMLLTQILIFFSIGALGQFDPLEQLWPTVTLAVLLALFSASQDIVIDAYRRELLDDDELGTGNAIAVNAYRLSSLVPGSLALILSDLLPWGAVYWIVASFMLAGMVLTAFVPITDHGQQPPRTILAAVVEPFREFFLRDQVERALLILAFLVLYKLGDNMATALSSVFYRDLGFTNTQIGTVAKFSALWATLAGGMIAGVIMLKLNINRSLWIFGVVQMISILGYAGLALAGPNQLVLFLVVSFEYLGVGMGTVGLTTFIAQHTARSFSVTQIALLTSLTAVPRIFANASTGFLVEQLGYFNFFLLCTALAIPGLILLTRVAPWNGTTTHS